jgi:hypothetical protein
MSGKDMSQRSKSQMRMGDGLNYSRVWNETLNQLSGVSRIVKAGDGGALMSTTGKMLGGGYRRVHNDGILMLDKHLHLKDSQNKVPFLELNEVLD